jgi:hypothetical protein
MVEHVTKITFPKDCEHKPLHIRPCSDDDPHVQGCCQDYNVGGQSSIRGGGANNQFEAKIS